MKNETKKVIKASGKADVQKKVAKALAEFELARKKKKFQPIASLCIQTDGEDTLVAVVGGGKDLLEAFKRALSNSDEFHAMAHIAMDEHEGRGESGPQDMVKELLGGLAQSIGKSLVDRAIAESEGKKKSAKKAVKKAAKK